MKKKILVIVNELSVAFTEEIASILRELSSEIKSKTLSLKLKEMEEEKALFKVFPKENSYGVEVYIAGPNADVKDDFEIKKLIVEQGFAERDPQCIDWELFSSRVLDTFLDDLKGLQEDMEKSYEEPKEIEVRYFDLSLTYHELYGFFFDRYDTDFLVPVKTLLEDWRKQLDKIDI